MKLFNKRLLGWVRRGYQITYTGRNLRQNIIHTCSPDDRDSLTRSFGVNGIDASCVRLILLQAINHVRGGITLQHLLIDHPRSIGWDNKREEFMFEPEFIKTYNNCIIIDILKC